MITFRLTSVTEFSETDPMTISLGEEKQDKYRKLAYSAKRARKAQQQAGRPLLMKVFLPLFADHANLD